MVFFFIQRSKRTKNHTLEWLFENVRHFGYLLDYNTEKYDEYMKFQDLLDIIDVNNQTGLFDPQDKFEFKVDTYFSWASQCCTVNIMIFQLNYQQITPKCEDLLVRCRWGNTHLDCMKIFRFRKTREGYCCTFNYVRQFNTLSATEE